MGSIITEKVPGNMHISSHDYRDVLFNIQNKYNYSNYNLDLSHKIYHFSIGNN